MRIKKAKPRIVAFRQHPVPYESLSTSPTSYTSKGWLEQVQVVHHRRNVLVTTPTKGGLTRAAQRGEGVAVLGTIVRHPGRYYPRSWRCSVAHRPLVFFQGEPAAFPSSPRWLT